MEIDGSNAEEFDQLIVSGLFDVDGCTVIFELLDGIADDIFEVFALKDFFRVGDEMSNTGLTDCSLFDDVNKLAVSNVVGQI